MTETGMAPGTALAVGTAREAAPATGMVHVGRATGMARANIPGMAHRRVPAENRSTAEADRRRRRRPIASTSQGRAALPTTDLKGRVRPAFLIRDGRTVRPIRPVMSPQQLKPTPPRSNPTGVSCEANSTDFPGCNPLRGNPRRLRGRSLRPAALGRYALSTAPWRRLHALSATSWRRSAALSPPSAGAANAAAPTPRTTPAILGACVLHPGVWPATASGLRRQGAATPRRRPLLHHRTVTDGAAPIRGRGAFRNNPISDVESKVRRLAAVVMAMASVLPLSGCGYLASAISLDHGYALEQQRPSSLPLSPQPSIGCVKDRMPSPTCFPAAPGRMSAWR